MEQDTMIQEYVDPSGHRPVLTDDPREQTIEQTRVLNNLAYGGEEGLKRAAGTIARKNGEYNYEEYMKRRGYKSKIKNNNTQIENTWQPQGFTKTIESPNQKMYMGMTKFDNKTSIDYNFNPNPDSDWQVNNDGSISYEKEDMEITINPQGEMTINKNGTIIEIKKGNYYLGQRTEMLLEGASNKYFDVSVSTQPIISKGLIPFKDIEDGYVPIVKYIVDINAKSNQISITNETTVSIHQNIRDTAYVATTIGVAYEAGGVILINKLLSSGYNRPAIEY